jgi:TrmH family RNA methyltransferase
MFSTIQFLKKIMKKITSVENPLIKALSQLDKVQERYRQQRFSGEGIRVCATLIASGVVLEQLYVTESLLSKAQELCPESFMTLISDSVLKKISHTITPSGIVGIFTLPKQPLSTISTGIILANISDPGNMGTLIRSCIAFGKKTVIVLDGVDPWNPKVVQASAGTIGYAHIFTMTMTEFLGSLPDLPLIGLVVQNGKKPQEIKQKDALLVIGSEAHGIMRELEKQCTELMTLPMPGGTESLNAAVAGSIAMYELWIC